jgi:nicotinate-nucleotide adenylyltransferase
MTAGAPFSELAPGARAARRLGILGGSFDPPHRGHLAMARAARRARELDHVLWVPAARPPHKPERELVAGAERVRMLELLLVGDEASSIWTVELERAGPSYTVDTVRALRAEVPDAALHLVLGTDNLPGLPSWREAAALLALVEPVVIPRSGSPAEPPELTALGEDGRARVVAGLVETAPVDVSSSEVRALLAAGADDAPALADALPEALREYVLARGFYRGG